MPKLVWSGMTVLGKSTRKSHSEDGFLVLSNGTKLEGQIALKCRFDKERNRWVFLEAEFREAKGQESRKIPASEIQILG